MPGNGKYLVTGGSGADRQSVPFCREGMPEGGSASFDRLDGAAVGSNPKVRASQIDSSMKMGTGNVVGASSSTDLNPMIQAPLRSIDAPLQNPFFETCEQNLPYVGDTVLITVLEIHDVGGTCDDDAASCRHHAETGR